MARLLEFSFRRWSAWAPAMADVERWKTWARGDAMLGDHEEMAPVKAMPPLLRRRAQSLGRAALEVLYAPALAYAGQPIVFCSRHGETSRSFAILQALAADEPVSPQEFSMSVNNAIPSLFLIAKKNQTSVIAPVSEKQLMLSGVTEALGLLADGEPSVILVFCDAPLPALFRPFIENEPTCFAFALEVTAGKDYCLVHDEAPLAHEKTASILPHESSLPLLHFVLDETQSALPLTGTADWQLLRLAPEPGHA